MFVCQLDRKSNEMKCNKNATLPSTNINANTSQKLLDM